MHAHVRAHNKPATDATLQFCTPAWYRYENQKEELVTDSTTHLPDGSINRNHKSA